MDRAVAASGRERRRDVGRWLGAQILGAGVWCVVAGFGAPVWVASASALAAACLVPIRIRDRDAVSLVTDLLRYRFGAAPAAGVVRDFSSGSGHPVGLRWYGPFVTAVVEVVPPPGTVTRVGRDEVRADATLPLAAIAACLRRHDAVLDGIDVVLHGWRVRDETPAGQAYSRLVGPLPAAAERTVWVVVRLDVRTCPDVIARRGGGTDGAARAVVAAARRVVRALSEGGCGGRLLSAREVERAGLRVSHGVPAGRFEQARTHVVLPSGRNTGGAFDPRTVDRVTTTRVWTVSTLSSTLTVRLRPGDHGSVRVGALARFTTRTPGAPEVQGLWSAHMHHRESLTAALPSGVPRLGTTVPMREVRTGDLDELALPADGCGQLVGSDDAGRAVTVRLTGPRTRTVYLAGEFYLAQQVVFRAVAVGARVVLYTDRPGAWRPLLDSASGPDRLRIAGEHAGDREFDTVVYDGARPTTAPPHATEIHVHTHPDDWPRERPTVSILQPGASGDRVVLTAAGRRIPLTLVTIAAETNHLGRTRSPEPVRAR